MTRNRLLKTIVLLFLATHASSQLIDFFQSFNAFLQPYQTNKQNGGTRKQASKPTNRRIDDLYFQNEQNSRLIDPFGVYTTTTVKPRKNRIKTTTKNWFDASTEAPKKKSNLINTNIHFIDNRNINNGHNGNRNTDNDNRKVVNNNNEYNINNYNQNNRKTTTSRTTTNSYDYFNRYTTSNPLLNRPGVRPAVVDENRPPITNRPVTKRPIYFPTEPTKRPTYTQTPKPICTQQTTKKPNFGPVTNSPGPDFEEEEPDIEIGPDEDDMSEAEKRRYLQIAEQKCDEYKSMNVKKVVALPLSPSGHGVEVNVSTCTPSTIPLIIGGKVVSINEFPHMGLVGWKRVKKSGYSWKCGGSLISEQHVLTAGHCTYQDKDYNVVSGPPHAVQLGSSYLDDRSATVIRVSAVIRHAKYKLRRSYYDVALIRLATVVSFSEVISPACLGVPPPEGEPVIATGWGKTEFGGESSYELRSVSIPIWNMDDCREIWGTSRKLPNGPSPDSQLCAGEKQGGKDTCQGDSGGPAQLQDGCVWRVVAVTSVGRSCGAPDTPALYARVPRAFIASQAFGNIKLNDNHNNNNWNNDNNNNNRFNSDNTGSYSQNAGSNTQNTGYNVNNQFNSNNNPNTGSYSQNSNYNRDNENNNAYNNQNSATSNGFNVNSNGFNVNNQYNGNNNRETVSSSGYNVNNDANKGYNANDNRNYNTGVVSVVNSDSNAYNVNNNQNNRYNANNNIADNRYHNTNPLETTVNDNKYSTTNLNNNQQNTNNRNQNIYNNNHNKKDNSVITQPAVQNYYNNQFSSTPNNYNNNWANNNSPSVNYDTTNNGYNADYYSQTTHNYNDFNRNNNYGVNANNHRFPIVSTPWWSK